MYSDCHFLYKKGFVNTLYIMQNTKRHTPFSSFVWFFSRNLPYDPRTFYTHHNDVTVLESPSRDGAQPFVTD